MVYIKKHIFYVSGEKFTYLENEKIQTEEEFEELWKTFHKTIAIQERTNKKCQQNFMPKKYWKNMLEMENEL